MACSCLLGMRSGSNDHFAPPDSALQLRERFNGGVGWLCLSSAAVSSCGYYYCCLVEQPKYHSQSDPGDSASVDHTVGPTIGFMAGNGLSIDNAPIESTPWSKHDAGPSL